MLAMSTTRGTFSSTSAESVSRLAAISGRAAFLAPEMGSDPLSGRPPWMTILSMKVVA